MDPSAVSSPSSFVPPTFTSATILTHSTGDHVHAVAWTGKQVRATGSALHGSSTGAAEMAASVTGMLQEVDSFETRLDE